MLIGRAGPERLGSYRAIVLLIAVIAGGLIGWMTYRSPRNPLELKTEDALVRMSHVRARPDIVMVALDDRSVQRYGSVQKWRRSVLADGLARIEEQNPRWVILDLALDGRTHTGDEALWRQIARNRNVVLAMAYDGLRGPVYTPDDIRSLRFLERFAVANGLSAKRTAASFDWAKFEPPVSDFTQSARGVGVFDRETDTNGVVRTARMLYVTTVRYPQANAPLPGKFPISTLSDGLPVALPNIALVSALRAVDLDKQAVGVADGESLQFLGTINPRINIPLDGQERMNTRYGGPAGRYATASFVDLIDRKVAADAFKGKIVLVGPTAPGDSATEARGTPMGVMARPEITANALQTILDRSYFWRPEIKAVGIMLLLGLATGLLLMGNSGVRQTLFALIGLLVYLILAFVFYAFGHVLLPILPGVLVVVTPYVVAQALALGPYRPVELEASPTYVPPGRIADHPI